MKNRIPFYQASKFETFKIFLIAIGGAIISLATLMLVFWGANENWPPTNTIWPISILIGVLGLCGGLGWYDKKYTLLRLTGGIISFVAGLTTAMVFTDFDILIRIPMGLGLGVLCAIIGCFLVWIDPEIYTE